jgi:hypothetical protein
VAQPVERFRAANPALYHHCSQRGAIFSGKKHKQRIPPSCPLSRCQQAITSDTTSASTESKRMPTLFSKWNGKSLKPATTSRYGQGISSSDLHAGAEDATQLKNVPDVAQVTKKKKLPQPASEIVPAPALKSDPYTLPSPSPSQSQAHGPDTSAWRVVASQQLLPNPLSEFGAGSLSQPVQRASTTKPTRSRNESRALYSSSTLGAHPSTKQSARKTSLNDSATAVSQPPSYGYTTFGWDTQMDVTRATEIVLACGQQIRARGTF